MKHSEEGAVVDGMPTGTVPNLYAPGGGVQDSATCCCAHARLFEDSFGGLVSDAPVLISVSELKERLQMMPNDRELVVSENALMWMKTESCVPSCLRGLGGSRRPRHQRKYFAWHNMMIKLFVGEEVRVFSL
jgi:hypothetical protein